MVSGPVVATSAVGTARHRAVQAARGHARLGGAAAHAAGDRARHVEEELTAARLVVEVAEQHEQERVGRRDLERCAEDADVLDRHHLDEVVDAEVVVAQRARHPAPEYGERQHPDQQQGEPPARAAPAKLHHQRDQRQADDDVPHRGLREAAAPVQELVVEDDVVERDRKREARQGATSVHASFLRHGPAVVVRNAIGKVIAMKIEMSRWNCAVKARAQVPKLDKTQLERGVADDRRERADPQHVQRCGDRSCLDEDPPGAARPVADPLA